MKQENYSAAAEFFSRLVKDKPNLPEAHLNLGKCLFMQENYEQAKLSLHRALELKPAPDVIASILEVTNWKMVSSPQYFNGSPAFSRDGSLLAYVSARRDTNGDSLINSLDRGGIYVYRFDTDKEQCVVPDSYNNASPVFSPDGKKLVYLSARPEDPSGEATGNPALYLLELETGREIRLLDESNRVKYPGFTPDGETLVFSCWRKGQRNSAILALHLKTGKQEIIVSGNEYENTFPSLSPAGNQLVYSSWRKDTNGDGQIDIRDNSGIYLKDLGGVVESVIADNRYNNTFPSFSLDGGKIVYHSTRADTNNDGKIDSFDNAGIYVYDLRKKREYCVVDDNYYNRFASFIIDNDKVVFISNMRSPGEQHRTRGYFEFKGIYLSDIYSRKVRKLVSEEFYGSRSLVTSSRNSIAYVSWHHESGRGLYAAFLDRLPLPAELHAWIDRNL